MKRKELGRKGSDPSSVVGKTKTVERGSHKEVPCSSVAAKLRFYCMSDSNGVDVMVLDVSRLNTHKIILTHMCLHANMHIMCVSLSASLVYSL